MKRFGAAALAWSYSMKISKLSVIAFVIICAAPTRADSIYIESGGTTLYTVNSTNGASTLVGTYGVTGVLAQAFSPSGTLYAIFKAGSTSAQLATVNINTGAATPIGSPAGVPLEAMAFAPNGTLYAGNFNTNNLYTINLSTGAATLVGPLGFSGIMDMAWDPGNNTMYAIASLCAGSSLYSINLANGAGTLVTPIPSDSCLMALAVDSGNHLSATDFASASPLFQLDPATGNLTSLGSTGLASTMGATAAPTPEPLTAVTLSGGLAAMWLRKKVRAKARRYV